MNPEIMLVTRIHCVDARNQSITLFLMECQNVIRGTTQLPTHGFGQTSVEGMKGRVTTGNGIRYPTSKAQWIYGGGGPGGYLTILTMAATCDFVRERNWERKGINRD